MVTALAGALDNAQALLRVESLTKDYGDTRAVSEVSFTLEPGTFFALLGPSGCGKTTLIKMLAGFEVPSSGKIFLGDQAITDAPPFRRPVNTVFQHYALFPHMNVRKNVGYALHQRRPRPQKSEIERRVNDSLHMVQLDHLAHRRPWELSGGQQQRVALARALVAEPLVLLLDEPLSALDARLRIEMQAELKSLQARLGISFIFVTHDQNEALSMADRIAVMRDGRIVQDSTPRDLYDRPVDSWVGGFIGAITFVPGTVSRVDGDRAELVAGGRHFVGVATVPDLAVGADVQLALRPERVRLVAADGDREGRGTRPVVPGVIESFSFRGDQIDYQVRTVDIGVVKVRVPLVSRGREANLKEGAQVHLTWDEDDARIVPSWKSALTT